jgi:sugar phosphate isomerase/epimerase
MARPVLLFTGPWSDLPLEELAGQVAEWGYQGLELCCWGDHFGVQRAQSEDAYAQSLLDLFNRLELAVPVVSNHRVSTAVCDPIDARHRDVLPDYVWGDGNPAGVRERAAEEMMATARAAQKLGAAVLGGFLGSPVWSCVAGYPAPPASMIDEAFREVVRRWQPILDVCGECGLRYAFEAHPGQIAFDLYSTERLLDALSGREEFGLLFDPGHLHWQGVDPVEFVRRFGDRVTHVHVRDVAVTLTGRSGLLNSYLPPGDPRRGWSPRAPGHGGLDWEAIVRALNEVGYDGALAVEWQDPGMDRSHGAEEACAFVGRLNFEPPPRAGEQPFR